MADLPDISELLKGIKGLNDFQKRLRKEERNAHFLIKNLQQIIIERYKEAKVPYDKCDHPVKIYEGMGNSSCACCDKALT